MGRLKQLSKAAEKICFMPQESVGLAPEPCLTPQPLGVVNERRISGEAQACSEQQIMAILSTTDQVKWAVLHQCG